MTMYRIRVILFKELRDALRDRRTLLAVLLSSVITGPAMLGILSWMVSDMEQKAERREVYVVGIERAPSLRNYFERQSFKVLSPPADYQTELTKRRFGDPVLIVPEDFERELAAGDPPTLELVDSSVNLRAHAGSGRIQALVRGFVQEQANLRLRLRGISPELLTVAKLDDHDLADARARSANIMSMVPFFVLMAVLYGCLSAALDTTAGERERQSLEPLLMNPVSPLTLVLGKWAAVAALAMAVAILACIGFMAGQSLIGSERLAALFHFGGREAGLFLALLLPLAAALSALLMAVAIRCRSYKEAQASSAFVVLAVSLLPVVSMVGQEGDKPWYLWLPVLAQSTLMGRVLRGEELPAADLLLPLAVAALVAGLCLLYVARQLKRVSGS